MPRNRLSALALAAGLAALSTTTYAGDGSKQKDEEGDYRHFLQAGYQVAYVFPMNNFIRGENKAGEPITSLQAGRLEFAWQTTGSKRWHQIWNYPAFGIGHTTIDYFNEDEVGTPSAVYGFVALPVKRWKRWTLTIAPGFGVSYGWKPFDPVTNPDNQSIGAFKAAFIDINTHFTYFMSRHWDLVLALPAYHFSNGGTRKPNNGFNQMGPMASLRYKFEADPNRFRHWDDIPAFKGRNEIVVTGAWGLRNIKLDPNGIENAIYANADFSVYTFSAAWLRQSGYMHRWGAGVDLVYDSAVQAQADYDTGKKDTVEVSGFDQTRIGLFGAYEFVIKDLAILANLGYTVRQTGYDTGLPRLYQRVGFRYTLPRDWLLGLSVRFKNFSSADHLEWTVGKRFRL